MGSPVVTLRPGEPGDASRLRELTWQLTVANPAYRDHAEAQPDAITGPDEALANGGVIVAEVGGKAIGYICVIVDARGEAEVDGLFVDADFQRRGIGRRLLEGGVERARGRGATVLTVVSAPDVVGVYEAFGLRCSGPAETLFGPAVMMQMPLETPAGAD